MLIQFLGVWLFLLSSVSAQTCSSTSRCAEGCCNEFGNCGYGPDFCGKDTCISDCDRKSECNPGYGAEWSDKDKCPLNVCCSKHGYCGTTEEFCGDKKVHHKTCSTTSGNRRIVGYFEGWAQDRPCNVFWPEDIPIGLYTHINFAFATIDPQTFKVQPASELDVGLYERLGLLKQRDPDLRTYIAIGGWTFNDPGPTQMVFSDLAASVPRQKVFIESLISFMSTYGFDGVDLDWEYPRAPDRAGREVDYENFPKFMKRLKESLDGASKGVTITLPASYWYLQHFDIVALAESVSWFNIMSYDLHGTWDRGNQWTGAFLNAHTNLTEIDLALDLLWRNDIDPSMVVMGLGFYGRSFSATSPTCLEPGCTFASGGEKGDCSREVGILLNSEIDELVAQHGVEPQLYEKATVKVASWGNQWVAYDDEETLGLKSRYAQSMCLGGLMVWAISHDTKDAKYNKALARVANRKIMSLPMTDGSDDEAYDFVDVPNAQCKWTNCGESCPSGWALMKRKDGGARNGEYMWDDTGCGGGLGVHSFCCPPSGNLPTCGWYTHYNGACDSTCPDGTVEVGGNDKHCRRGYQAACCTTSGHKSMRLYTTCEWGEKPMCDDQKGCPNSPYTDLLAASTSGNGAGGCNMRSAGFWSDTWIWQEKKYCCDTSEKKRTFSDCEWYNSIGPRPQSLWCGSGCPGDRVRVALDKHARECHAMGSGGAKARCCVPDFSDTIEVENPKLDQWRAALEDFSHDPRCANPGPIFDSRRRSLRGEGEGGGGGGDAVAAQFPVISRMMMMMEHNGSSIHDTSTTSVNSIMLSPRAAKDTTISTTESLLLSLIFKSGTTSMLKAMEEIWNNWVPAEFGDSLHMPSFGRWLKALHAWDVEGPIQVVHSVICNPHYWAGLAAGNGGGGGGNTKSINCTLNMCEIEGNCGEDQLETGSRIANRELQKRAPRDYTVDLDGGGAITITLPDYLQVWELEEDDQIQNEAVDLVNQGDCTNSRVTHYPIPTFSYFDMEHIVEGQQMMLFMEDASAGRLRSGATASVGRVSASFFRTARTMPLPNPPPIPGGVPYERLFDRVMECLGSRTNRANFVILEHDINAFKARLVRGSDPIRFARIEAEAGNFAYPHFVLNAMRTSVAVVRYLDYGDGTPDVNQRLTNIVNMVGEQLGYGQRVWNQAHPAADQVSILEYWRLWVRDFYPWLVDRTRGFVRRCAAEMRKHWAVRTDDYSYAVLEVIRSIEDELDNLSIDMRGFD